MSLKPTNDIKVGIFVLIGTALIMLAIVILGGGNSFFSRTYGYTIHLDDAEGLIPGSKVILNGINVGMVDTVDFDKEFGKIQVLIVVRRDVKDLIRKNSKAEIATQGVLGDKYISIRGGTQDEPVLTPGAEIPPIPARDISQFISKGDELLLTLNKMASHLNHILASFEAENRSEQFFKNMTNAAKNLAQTTELLGQQINGPQIKESLTHFSQILDKINKGKGTIGALVNDASLYDEVRALMGGMNRNRIVRNLVRQTLKESDSGEAAPSNAR